jgi:hypothetical protein
MWKTPFRLGVRGYAPGWHFGGQRLRTLGVKSYAHWGSEATHILIPVISGNSGKNGLPVWVPVHPADLWTANDRRPRNPGALRAPRQGAQGTIARAIAREEKTKPSRKSNGGPGARPLAMRAPQRGATLSDVARQRVRVGERVTLAMYTDRRKRH